MHGEEDEDEEQEVRTLCGTCKDASRRSGIAHLMLLGLAQQTLALLHRCLLVRLDLCAASCGPARCGHLCLGLGRVLVMPSYVLEHSKGKFGFSMPHL